MRKLVLHAQVMQVFVSGLGLEVVGNMIRNAHLLDPCPMEISISNENGLPNHDEANRLSFSPHVAGPLFSKGAAETYICVFFWRGGASVQLGSPTYLSDLHWLRATGGALLLSSATSGRPRRRLLLLEQSMSRVQGL